MSIPLLLSCSALLLSMPGHSGEKDPSAFYIVTQTSGDNCPCWGDSILDVRPSSTGVLVRRIDIVPVANQCGEVVTLQGMEREISGTTVAELAGGIELCTVRQNDVDRARRKAGWRVGSMYGYGGIGIGIVAQCAGGVNVLHLVNNGSLRFDRMQVRSPKVAAIWRLTKQVGEQARLASAEQRNLVDGAGHLDPWVEEVRSGAFDAGFANSCDSRVRRSRRTPCDLHPGATELARDGNPVNDAWPTTVEVRGAAFANFVQPEYPLSPKQARISGTVKVTLSVDPAGTVTDARIVLGHPLFTEATLSAARQWRVSVESQQAARTIEVLVDYRFKPDCP